MFIDQLPLFPLRTVLFPGMVLPLHIFEPRYIEMISACLADDPRFGVALISTGLEVGGPAVPHSVGTLARIVSVSRYNDGRMDLLTVGLQRFRVVSLDHALRYTRARVETLNDVPDADDSWALAVEVGALLDRYRRLLGTDEGPDEVEALPTDPETLSHIAGVLPMSTAEKQALLECVSAGRRLERLRTFLKAEIRLLEVLGPTRPLPETRRISRG